MQPSILILAGGKSTRMKGKDKANLKFHGETFLEGLYERLKPYSSQIMISEGKLTKREYEGELTKAEFVRDIYEDRGPLGGLYAGMCESEGEYLAAVACDMPYFDSKVIKYLMTFDQEEYDAIVPTIEERIQPLAGIYKKRLLPNIKEQLEEGDNTMKHFLKTIRVRYVEVGEKEELVKMLRNVNTTEEYKELIENE